MYWGTAVLYRGLMDTYLNWEQNLEIKKVIFSWCMELDGIFHVISVFTIMPAMVFVIIPTTTFWVPVVIIVNSVVILVKWIKAKRFVKENKEDVQMKEKKVLDMLINLQRLLFFVPKEYHDSQAIEYFYQCFCDGKADTVEDAVKLYEIYKRSKE